MGAYFIYNLNMIQESKSEAGLEKKRAAKEANGQEERIGLGNPCKEYLRNMLESRKRITVCCLRGWKHLPGGRLPSVQMKCPKARAMREADLSRALLGWSEGLHSFTQLELHL